MEPFLHRDRGWQGVAGNEPWQVEGLLASRPEGSGGTSRLLLEGLSVRHPEAEGGVRMLQGRLLLYVGAGRAQHRTGDRVRFAARIRIPRRYGLPGEADYPGYLALKGVQGVAFVASAEEVVPVSRGEGWRGALDAVAARLAAFIDRNVPGVEGGVLKALLIGDCSGVPQEVQDAYARAGVNHVLSISGFHVGIIYLCLFQALFLVARRSETVLLRCNLKRVLLLATLPVTVLYLFLSGCAPATVRSVLMIGALTCALWLKRETDPLNVILVSACAILAVAPQTLFDISFQLSFLAVWGLAALTPLLMPRHRLTGGARMVVLSVCASAAAVASTAVPAAFHFHRVSVAGIFCNLVVVPLIGYGAVVLGFASLLCAVPCPGPAGILIQGAGRLVHLADRAIEFCATFPVLDYQPDRLDVLLFLVALGVATFLPAVGWRRAGFAAVCLLIVWRGTPDSSAGDGRMHLLFLSVGQGDACLVRLPDGKSMLIDGGGSLGEADRVGERLLVPALLALKVRRIDYLVLSHPHPDHLLGLLPVAARWEVGEFWESGVPCDLREYRQLKWVLSSRQVPVRVLRGGSAPCAAGGATVQPLWPPVEDEGEDANDSSLVLRIGCGRGAALFPGDVGEDAEGALVASRQPLTCTILKVPHHGSGRSCSDCLLAASAPREAVVSAGYANPFHLPAPATVTRVERRGICLHRTDLEGSVEAVLAPDGSCLVSTPWQGAF